MAIDDRCKLFVAGLPDSISEAVLRQLFEATGGTVVDVSVPRDRATGRPRGFGFVTLSAEQEAIAARQALDGSMQSGRSISVRPFQAGPPKREGGGAPREGGFDRGPSGGGPGGGASEDRTLYLGNLPYDTSPAEVEQMLQRAGVESVQRVNLPLDAATGRPRGFGFVTLGSAEAAQAAVDSLREAELKGRRISASIAHARGTGPRPPRPSFGGGAGGPPPGGGYPPRSFAGRDEPRWGGGEGGGGDPGGGPPPEEGGDDRRGKNKKKRGGGAGGGAGRSDRKPNRRDGEGLRGPRARGMYDDDDD
ncbi:MAG TPA: RNA-binding protein [Polyangiaceae bacterium]|nr:RNA-binding protein [Polyangiaceae bacterium]